jgi:glycosyltransferase involved in cell wall biosynthesis
LGASIQNKLSICIACYGDDLTALLEAIEKGKENLPSNWTLELIAGDQHPEPTAKANAWETQFSLLYLHHPNGLGRGNNRNTIARASTGDYLLFLDADALPVDTEQFLTNYCNALVNADVVVGGTAYKSGSSSLRHTIGRRKEVIPAHIRTRKPHGNFSAFNFAIARSVFLKHSFDESLKDYGHEDTLFGQELRYACKTVTHIENAAYHEEVKLFAVYRKLQRTGAVYLMKVLRVLLARGIRALLIGGLRSVLLYDFYKLLRMSGHAIKIGRRNF